jgi:starch phosphorylase
MLDAAPRQMTFGDCALLRIEAHIKGLSPEDLRVELVLSRGHGERSARVIEPLQFAGMEDGKAIYALQMQPSWCGRLEYRVRAYPTHPLLTHPLETGLMYWL